MCQIMSGPRELSGRDPNSTGAFLIAAVAHRRVTRATRCGHPGTRPQPWCFLTTSEHKCWQADSLQGSPGLTHLQTSKAQSLSMDGFWMQVEWIQQKVGLQEEDGSRGIDLLPQEVGSPWLQDTGLPGLLGGQGLEGDHQGLLSTLTQTQRAAVRRLDVYTRSTQRRHEAPAGGVRDIFGGFSSTVKEVFSEDGDSVRKQTQLSSGASKSPPAAESGRRQAGRGGGRKPSTWTLPARDRLFGSCRGPATPHPLPGGTCSKCSLLVSTLPRGSLGSPKADLGIGDLSLQDMWEISALASNPTTAPGALLGLVLKRSKTGKQEAQVCGPETRRGVPLDSLLEADCKALPSTPGPLILQALLSCSGKERTGAPAWLSCLGPTAHRCPSFLLGRGQRLERDFHTETETGGDECPRYDASKLLKRFLRELPAPLVPAEHLPASAALPRVHVCICRSVHVRVSTCRLPVCMLHAHVHECVHMCLHVQVCMCVWRVSGAKCPSTHTHTHTHTHTRTQYQIRAAAPSSTNKYYPVASFLVSQVRELNNSSGRAPSSATGASRPGREDYTQRGTSVGVRARARTPKVAKVQVTRPIADPLGL
ncbi:rho gtpase-activating protein 40 [Lynx pardinus]|uniref:Rho gtpase-activating protein 40 n=1 Tax=Lynx pardinus TaxID=191816 RepID=A0A485M7W8_LYNPA|nr:rho gtpase-activating protein 40 [Lynx pardinus]